MDDHPNALLALQALLEPLGQPLRAASTGHEALRLLLEQDYAAVLLDVQLAGGMSGFEVARLMRERERTRRTPIIFITGADFDPDLSTVGYGLGAVDYLHKPVRAEALCAKVQVFVELFQAREEARQHTRQLQQRQRESLTRAHQAQLDALLVQAPAAIAITRGEDLVFEFANPVYERVMGRPIPLGRRLTEALPELAGQPAVLEALRRVLRTGEPFRSSEFVLALDRLGTGELDPAFLDLTYLPMRDALGRVDGVITFAVEVTGQVQARRRVEALAGQLSASERHYRDLFEGAGVSIWEADLSAVRHELDALVRAGVSDLRAHCQAHPELVERAVDRVRLVDVNVAALRMFGARSKQELRVSLRPLLLPESRETFVEQVVALWEGRTPFATVTPLRTLAGERLDVLLTSAASDPGKWHHVVLTLTDVSVRRAAEVQQERALVESQEAVRTRDAFLSAAAHELRTPLTALRLHHQLLARTLPPLPPEVRDALVLRLAGAMRQVDRLAELVERLLDVRRIADGALVPRPAPADLVSLTREVVGRMEGVFAQAGCVVTVEAPHPIPGQWDVPQLEQVLVHLLGNAAKYGEGSPVRVHLTEAGGTVRLAVADGGIGISPEDLPRLFRRFERVASDRHFGGLGLGLYICRQVVEAMGGRIGVESAPGRGTTFTVELPVHPAG